LSALRFDIANREEHNMAQSSYGSGPERFAEASNDQFRRVAERSSRTAEGVQEVVGNMKSALDKSISDQPMATLAAVAVVGFVLGVLWKM
jgi:ElaB/YqjD/DUF883 family membrane-anchored ribosome-binding protein